MDDKTGIIKGLRKGFRISVLSLEPISKGFSEDEKYCVTTADGTRLLLRISDLSLLARKKAEKRLMQQVAALGVPMSKSLGVFQWQERVYSLFSWCPGEDAGQVLPGLPVGRQYALGEETGRYLRLIHSIPAPSSPEDWAIRFSRKMDVKISTYRTSSVNFPGDALILDYLEANRHLLKDRPQSFQHGDYHTGNMVIDQEKSICILDFDRFDQGDPWEEFNRIVWSAKTSPAFATGQLDGYFGGRPPDAFFRLLALYIASNTLSSIPWAVPRGEQELKIMLDQANDVLSWFRGMTEPVPTWYRAPGRKG